MLYYIIRYAVKINKNNNVTKTLKGKILHYDWLVKSTGPDLSKTSEHVHMFSQIHCWSHADGFVLDMS